MYKRYTIRNNTILPPSKIVRLLTKRLRDKYKSVWLVESGTEVLKTELEYVFDEVTVTYLHDKRDFRETIPNFEFDAIISYPHFDKKNDFLFRCVEFGKPFALLMPLNTLEGITRHSTFKSAKDLSIILPNIRVEQDKNNQVMLAWFCFDMNLEKELIFEEVV